MSNLHARLAKMPPDQKRATLVTLPSHLARAVRSEQLHYLLSNFDFIDNKISELEPQVLIEDYELLKSLNLQISSAQQKSLRLIQNAIQLSAHILQKDKTQLTEQLLGRLFSQKLPSLQIDNAYYLHQKIGLSKFGT